VAYRVTVKESELDGGKLLDEAAIDFELDDGSGCAIVTGADCEWMLTPDFRLSYLDLSTEKVAELQARWRCKLPERGYGLFESVLTADDEATVRGECRRAPAENAQVGASAGAYRDAPSRPIVSVVPVGHRRVSVSWRAYALEPLIGLSDK
jgi:hypothetical protein